MAQKANVSKLKDLLLKSGVVDEFQMRAALGKMEQWGGRLPAVLVDMRFVDDEKMTETLASVLKLPTMRLGMLQKDSSAMSRLDPAFCEEHGCFPVSLQGRNATLAMSDPTELDTIDLVSARLNARVHVVIASETEIKNAINKHYRGVVSAASRKPDHTARDAHINATQGSVFELDTTEPPKPGEKPVEKPRGDFMSRPPSANTMLDEFFDEGGDNTEGFTPEELQRLEAARENQNKTAAIVRALQQLLIEKGFLN